MEENKNEVIETMDDGSGSNGLEKLVIAGLGIAAATVGVLAVKNKEKRLERAKKKLEAAGYSVEKPIIAEDYEEDDFLEEEVETDEESEN